MGASLPALNSAQPHAGPALPCQATELPASAALLVWPACKDKPQVVLQL